MDRTREREALAEWRGSLRALLRSHPELAEAIRAETAADPAPAAAGTGSISQVASVGSGVSIQSGRDTTLA